MLGVARTESDRCAEQNDDQQDLAKRAAYSNQIIVHASFSRQKKQFTGSRGPGAIPMHRSQRVSLTDRGPKEFLETGKKRLASDTLGRRPDKIMSPNSAWYQCTKKNK
jgi:hypothetical protein